MPRLTKKLRSYDYFIIAANLVPVFGAWFLGWNAIDIFIVYALETLLIGMITVVKLLIAAMFKGKDTWYNQGATQQVGGMFFIIFFILHFGIFAAVQTAIFSQSAGISPPGTGAMHFFFHWFDYINPAMIYMLGCFFIGYLGSSFIPFLLKKEYATIPMMGLMFQPYGRIFIQQFTVIIGSLFLTFGMGKVFILIFAIVKIIFEIYVNFEALIGKSIRAMGKESGKK